MRNDPIPSYQHGTGFGTHQVIPTTPSSVWGEEITESTPLITKPEYALKQWKENVIKISQGHEKSGFAKGGIYDLIEGAPFIAEHPEKVLKRRRQSPVSLALGITFDEETALYKYSQGFKDQPGGYSEMSKQNWLDLESAVRKIPSMEQLGTTATVFRADRTADFPSFLLSHYGKPCYILHGANMTGAGIHHLASAAFTANNHGIKAVALVRIVCMSARYVQFWGMHGGSMDGGEVLIPAGTISYYDGKPASMEDFAGTSKPIFTLVEVSPKDVKKGIEFFDDFKGNKVGRGTIDKLVPGLMERLENSWW